MSSDNRPQQESKPKMAKPKYVKPDLVNIVEQSDTRAPDDFVTVHHRYIGSSLKYGDKVLTSIVSPEIAKMYKKKMERDGDTSSITKV